VLRAPTPSPPGDQTMAGPTPAAEVPVKDTGAMVDVAVREEEGGRVVLNQVPGTSTNPRRRVVATMFVCAGLVACLAVATLTAHFEAEVDADEADPRRAQASNPAAPTCRNAVYGDPCHRHVMWAMLSGIHEHPEWYPGLSSSSTFREFQQLLHAGGFPECKAPCGTVVIGDPDDGRNETDDDDEPSPSPRDEPGQVRPVIGWEPMGQWHAVGQWCQAQAPADGWRLRHCARNSDVHVKVLTYNLFWWNLFGRRGGAGGSAGKLIAGSNQGQPYDVMGFQECEDVGRVLRDAGLQGEFTGVMGDHAMALAYRHTTWDVIEEGRDNVAEDRADQWYGTRGGLWIRLRHRSAGMTLFFMVHHGPLPVDSGGRCGGQATAFNIMKLMATHARQGDAIVLVGDFNSGLGSEVINTLQGSLHRIQSGWIFGGVDHIFSSCNSAVSTRNLGRGGSDHDALDAVLSF